MKFVHNSERYSEMGCLQLQVPRATNMIATCRVVMKVSVMNIVMTA